MPAVAHSTSSGCAPKARISTLNLFIVIMPVLYCRYLLAYSIIINSPSSGIKTLCIALLFINISFNFFLVIGQ